MFYGLGLGAPSLEIGIDISAIVELNKKASFSIKRKGRRRGENGNLTYLQQLLFKHHGQYPA